MLGVNDLLKTTILNTSKNHTSDYKRNVATLLGNSNNQVKPEEFDAIFKKYINDVSDSVFNIIKLSSPDIYEKVLLARKCPSICGYPSDRLAKMTKHQETYGLMAGDIYAVLYWAHHNKIVNQKEVSKLNDTQKTILKNATKDIWKDLNSIEY